MCPDQSRGERICRDGSAEGPSPSRKQVSSKTRCFSAQPTENKQPRPATSDKISRCVRTQLPNFYPTMLSSRVRCNSLKTNDRCTRYPTIFDRKGSQVDGESSLGDHVSGLDSASASENKCQAKPDDFPRILFKTNDRDTNQVSIFRDGFCGVFHRLFSPLLAFTRRCA